MAALLGLFWRLLREGRLKVARGRSWQPEIGMEHASRGRRSGNKGVGARWRGRFRIFSARHCSRTKVSHAENSGMTTVFFFLWGLLRCRGEWEREHEGGLIRCAGRPQEWSFGAVPPQERWHEGGWFLFFLWRLLRCRRGILSHALPWSNLRFPPELPAPPPQKTANYYGPLHRMSELRKRWPRALATRRRAE